MGGKWHVELWGQWTPCSGAYTYNTVYMGNSAFQAIRAFLQHRSKVGCCTLHYRGRKP